MSGHMSEPTYEFFPGAQTSVPPAGAAGSEPSPAGYGTGFGSAGTTVGGSGFGAPGVGVPGVPGVGVPVQPGARVPAGQAVIGPARPVAASVVGGLLIAEAAIVGGPAVALLMLRDLVGSLLSAFSSFASSAASLGGAASVQPDTSGVTGRITMWAVLLLLATLGAAVGSTGVLAGRAWGWGLALAVQAAGVLWAVLHVASWTATGSVALALSVAVAGLLAVPEVRRWCGAGTAR